MKIRHTFLLLLAVVLVQLVAVSEVAHAQKMAGVETQSNNGLQIMLHLMPAEPKANADTKVLLMTADAKTKKAATVDKIDIKWTMVMESMQHDIAADTLKAGSDGNYHGKINFPMGGAYKATVTTKYQGKDLKLTFTVNAKE